MYSLICSLWTFQFVALFTCLAKVTQTPSTACIGDSITVSCVLTVPNSGDRFDSSLTDFIIGDRNTRLPEEIVNGNGTVSMTDLSRFMADASTGNDTVVMGSVTLLSYTTADRSLRMGCTNRYFPNGGDSLMTFMQTLTLMQAAPPSAPISLQSSVSNFNISTCSANISLSWNTPPSNRTVDRYFLYLDGSPLATTNSTSYNHSTILNINTDYQYSVTAMSCAGNSTTSSSNVNSVKSYSLMRSSQYVCLAYNNVTGRLTVNWGLSTPTQPSGLDISYSLQFLYSHSRKNVTYRYVNSTSFTLPSSQLSYNTTITPHNFAQLDEIVTNIATNLTIVQQCGQSFSGTAMECFYNSKNLLIPPTSTLNTVSPTTSTLAATTSSTGATLTPTPTPFPTSTPTNDTVPPSQLLDIIGSAVGVVAFLFILITLIIMFALLVIFLRKKKEKTKQTGLDGSDVKKYDELEDTYSKVNKKNKVELTYLEIDHSSGTGKIVRPPTIPPTNYVDIADLPQESLPETTQYVSLQN